MSEAFAGLEAELTAKILNVFYAVYNELGSGFYETVYGRSMVIALQQAGMKVQTEVPISASFRGEVVGIFKADLLVNDLVILELKAVDQITKQHESQLLHYLRSSTMQVGLILNFGPVPSRGVSSFRTSESTPPRFERCCPFLNPRFRSDPRNLSCGRAK